MRSPCRAALVFGLLALTAGSAVLQAQQPLEPTAQMPNFDPTSLSDVAVVQPVDGVLWGAGRNFKVRFGSDRVEFFPMLGAAAPRNMPVEFVLQGTGRGTKLTVSASDLPAGSPVADGLRVEYPRGFLTERYDVRKGEIEQSFVFDRLPEGQGDLFVRLDLRTELEVQGDGTTLDLHYGSLGSVHIGKVIGIDANGVRAEGAMRYEGGTLELSLPAEFVDQAALPLVLDPVIGSNITIQSTNDAESPDIAYDRTENVYLVVYTRVFSSTDRDVWGLRVSSGGTAVGTTILIENNTANQIDPHVGNVNLRDAFLVVWNESNDIIGRVVPADSTLAVSARGTIAGTTDSENEPDVGGEFGLLEDDALVVWDNDTANTIEVCQVQITSTLTVGAVITRTTVRGGTATKTLPTIAKSGGEDGQFLICWTEFASSFNRIYGAVYDRNCSVTDSLVIIASASDVDRLNPACDGDGRRWVVAYERDEAGSPGDQDIYARSVYLEGTVARTLSGEIAVESNTLDDENSPDVAWMGESAIVVYDDETGSTYAARIENVNLFECTNCEPIAVPDSRSTHRVLGMAVASRFSGGPFSSTSGPIIDDALVAWEARDTTSNTSEVLAIRWDALDGAVADLGGGCGGGGDMRIACAHSGGNFSSRIFGANTSATAWLILSPRSFEFPCGTCVLVPDPFIGIPIATATSTTGTASVEVFIPSGLNGAVVYAQWAVAGGSTCTGLNTDLSNAARITIQD